MNQEIREKVIWTSKDLELFPDDGKRYEIVDGELLITGMLHWYHQKSCTAIASVLNVWSENTGLGEVAIAPGIIFSNYDNVIPDIV